MDRQRKGTHTYGAGNQGILFGRRIWQYLSPDRRQTKKHHYPALPYHIFKVEMKDLENGDRGEGLYYMEKETYVKK